MRRLAAALLAPLLWTPAFAVELTLPAAPEAPILTQTAAPSPLSALVAPQPLTLSAIAAAPLAPVSLDAPSEAARAIPAIAAASALGAEATKPASAAAPRTDEAKVSDLYGRYFDGRLIAQAANLVADKHIDEPRTSFLYARALRGFLEKAAPADVRPVDAMNALRKTLRGERVTFGFAWSKPSAGYPNVTAVAAGSPARRAGLSVGDTVVSIDGVDVSGMSGEDFSRAVERAASSAEGARIAGLRRPDLGGERAEFSVRMEAAAVRVPPSHPSVARDVAALFANLISKIPRSQAVDAVDAALTRMLRSLDKHTRYMKPADAKAFREEMRGEKAGVGIGIIQKDGVSRIIRVFPRTPAAAAGVQAGDVLTAVDGESVRGLPLERIQERLKRAEGAPVRLTIERAGASVELSMSAATIHLPMTYSQMFDGGRGYVRLREFTQTSHEDLVLAIRELRAKGATSLVLDLRYNPGGDLHNAVNIAAAFLPAGAGIGSTRSDKEHNVAEVETAGEFVELPLVVLINRQSASASELVSMALKDHGRAAIVGEASYGKGSGQRGYPLPNGGTAVVTTFKWYSPNGTNVGDKPVGVQPTVSVPLSEEEFLRIAQTLAAAEGGRPLDPVKDAALARALALLSR